MPRGVVMLAVVAVLAERVVLRDDCEKVDEVALASELAVALELYNVFLRKGRACRSIEFDARLS
jgi:hypothetical protein